MPHLHVRLVPFALAAFAAYGATPASAQQPAPGCPPLGWAEGLGAYQKTGAAFPTRGHQAAADARL